jgi:hypothetical protein
MSQLEFDENAARQLEAVYFIADAVCRRRIVREALGAAPGERGEYYFAIVQFCFSARKPG